MVVTYGYSYFQYNKAKKMVENWDGRDEDVLERADEILGLSITPSNIMMVCNFFLYSAMTYISGVRIPELGASISVEEKNFSSLVLSLVLFVLNMAFITITQKLTIELTKKINPEKRGNILDSEFQKVWLASCDEAQKQMIFEAAYKAYQAAQYACVVMWLLTLIGMLLFDIGIIPSICVFVIWLTMVVSYSIACHKLGKKGV